MSDFGLYIHIPFCKNKCPYCDFFSGKGTQTDYDDYIKELENKIEYWSGICKRQITSVYFGGGTPSVLGAERLCRAADKIFGCFSVCNDAEITAEINPESGKNIDFSLMKSSGFNRISIGLQSAQSNELKTLGRIHTAEEASLTVERAVNAGIRNVSLDLMMGIPSQSIESLKKSIDFCAQCGVTHISSYLLKIEEGTKYYSIKEQLSIPDDDFQAELYLFAVDYLKSLGYYQYEISNFAKDGFESRHNTNYWKCGEYIGIGPSAHSFLNGRRFYYGRSMIDFKNNIVSRDGAGGDAVEYIMLSLRLKRGVEFEEYRQKYGKPLPRSFFEKVNNYAHLGYMTVDENRCGFTTKGFLMSNYIIGNLIDS